MRMNEERLDDFIGASTEIVSRKWGKIRIESAHLTDVADGDLVVTVGNPWESENPLVRIHSVCTFAEVFESEHCDCRDQLHIAMAMMRQERAGILFYLRRDGRGIGLSAKVKAMELEMRGIDTYESRKMIGRSPDSRNYTAVGEYLRRKGVTKLRLLTNNPDKVNDIARSGLTVQPTRLLVTELNQEILRLYNTKRLKFGHNIPALGEERQLDLQL